MKLASCLLLGAALLLLPATPARSQTPGATSGPALDPGSVAWPRTFTAGGSDVAVFQPDINTWANNQLSGRFAVGIRPTGSKDESYGTVTFSARMEIDKLNRLVTLEDFVISSPNFPTQPEKAASYLTLLTEQLPKQAKVIPLDHLEAVFVLSTEAEKQVEVAVKNDPPQIIYTTQPAVLVLVDGAPVLRNLDPIYDRVINTRAVLLLNKLNTKYYCYAAGKWYNSPSLEGPFASDPNPPADIAPALQLALATNKVDAMLPTVGEAPPLNLYTSMKAAELVQTTGIANLVPVEGTASLLYVTNTDNALFMDTATADFYALVSGRWFSGPSLYGPWAFVPPGSLPSDFQKIPSDHPKSNVLASVPGTAQAREAVIASSIPQTATVDRSQAKLTVNYSGAPAFAPISGTALQYASNTATPVIMLNAYTYYANEGGLWFVADAPAGPWTVATSVPQTIYTIPPSSPIYYVTSCYVYGSTPQYVYTGYTPGYQGAVVAVGGVVVNGTGYVYPPAIIGSDWIGYPPTYGYGWGMAVGAFTGFAFGYAAGVSEGYWCHPYWGGYGFAYQSGWNYAHVNVNSTSFYNHWGTAIHSSGSWGYNACTGREWAGQHASAFNPYSGARAEGSRGAAFNQYNGNFAAGRQGAAYNPSTGRFVAGQRGVVGNAYTGNAASVDRGVAGNVNTGNAVAWNHGNVYSDHQGNIHSYSASGVQSSYDRGGWQDQRADSVDRSWDSSGAQRQSWGQSMGGQRFNSFRSGGGGGWGGSRGGRRR
ncbi:MAG: carbohydrate-binding family V/XII [Verrucomicrobiota bacterium]